MNEVENKDRLAEEQSQKLIFENFINKVNKSLARLTKKNANKRNTFLEERVEIWLQKKQCP